MSLFGDLFDGRARRARAAEAEGRHRDAAALWAELERPVDAARCLEHVGDKALELEERLSAWLDGLALLPALAVGERRALEAKIGEAILLDAKAHGLATSQARARLADAAARLERAEAFVDAADAFAMLGRRSDEARCLELGGEVERLEALLAESNASEAREAKIRRLVSESELAMALGDRVSARASLREVVALAPDDPGLGRLARRIEERWVTPPVTLSVGGRRVSFSARLPAIVGRADADVVVRGSSVSRAHAEVRFADGRFLVRDAGSRNGTLVAGVLLAGSMPIDGELTIGLGEDVTLVARPSDDALALEVTSGLDRGALHVLGSGRGALRIPGVGATLELLDDAVRLVPPPGEMVELSFDGAPEARRVQGRIDLLRGDRVRVGEVSIEVIA